MAHITLKTAQDLARASTDPLAAASAATTAQRWLGQLAVGLDTADPGVQEVLESITG